MLRNSITFVLLTAGGMSLAAPPLEAQLQELVQHRFEITPFAGYQWGGSFETDPFDVIPAGELQLADSWSWGVVVSFLARRGSALELLYLRQDTDVGFKPTAGVEVPLGGFANNYIQIGGRQDFGKGKVKPFITGSLGVNILDPKADPIGSEVKFSFSLGGGAKYMFGEAQRVGLRTDIRWWLTPVPSGDYGTWCDFYGCFVVEGTAWLSQGQVSGGIVFAF